MVRSADYVNEDTSNLRHADAAKQTTEIPPSLANIDDLSRCLDPDPTENVSCSDDDVALDSGNGDDLPTVVGANLTTSVRLSAGDVVANRYVIVSRLPGSGKGQIFKALDRYRNEANVASPYVALKFPIEAFGEGSDAVAGIQNEFRRLSQLNHENIVQVIDIGVHKHVPFIVMEWLEGKSLAQVLNEQSSTRMH